MEFLRETLPNGLDVIAEVGEKAHSTSVGFFVRTGSRDESDAVSGVSHFLEHMVFKGTPSRTADEVNREFDAIGAHYNAYTSEENTVFYGSILPEYQSRCVALLADILRPSLRSEDFETEKQVIIEEIRMYEDQPPFCADERCKAVHFGCHPLGRSVLGSVERIVALTVEQMREYFGRRYAPRNIVLVGTGRVDFDRLVADAKIACGEWEDIAVKRETTGAEPIEAFTCVQKETATQEYAVQLAEGPSCEEDARYAAKVLATVVGDETGSRLYWELVDPGRAEQANLGHYEYQGAGLYMTYMCCEPAAVEENLRRVATVYRQVDAEGVTADELDRAKRKLGARVVLGGERPRGRLFNVGTSWIGRGDYQSVQDDLAAVSAVTQADVAAVLSRYPLSRVTTVLIGPETDVARPE